MWETENILEWHMREVGNIVHLLSFKISSHEPHELGTLTVPILQRILRLSGYITLSKISWLVSCIAVTPSLLITGASHYMLPVIVNLVKAVYDQSILKSCTFFSVDKNGHCRLLRKGGKWFTMYFRRVTMAEWRMLGEMSNFQCPVICLSDKSLKPII